MLKLKCQLGKSDQFCTPRLQRETNAPMLEMETSDVYWIEAPSTVLENTTDCCGQGAQAVRGDSPQVGACFSKLSPEKYILSKLS